MFVASGDGSLAACLQLAHCRADSCIAGLHHTPSIVLVTRGPKKFPVKISENKRLYLLFSDLAALIFTYALFDGGDAWNSVKRSLERKVGLVFARTWQGVTLRAWKAMGVPNTQ